MPDVANRILIPVRDYDLTATLSSGQAFRWRPAGADWIGIVAGREVRLTPAPAGIWAQTHGLCSDWGWLTDYLQTGVDLDAVLRSFPDDTPMRASVGACRGLRLLRQDPWECLVSFICSSTKQIVQIQQIIDLVCERFGEPVGSYSVGATASTAPLSQSLSGTLSTSACFDKGSDEVSAKGMKVSNHPQNAYVVSPPDRFRPPEHRLGRAFPPPARLAAATESELRECKMGFRAPYVLAAAQAITEGRLDLEALRQMPCGSARDVLTTLPGVGPKIANCVLLFAYGFPEAFPVDVWVMKALRELYFPRRRPSPKRLRRFVETYFGANAGYAQQYLFHFMRTREENPLNHRP